MTSNTGVSRQSDSFLVPTVAKQCWGFMIGSAFFAVASAPGLSSALPRGIPNLLCFIGAWFFTGAGFVQLVLSGDRTVPVSYPPGRMVRAEWLCAAAQTFGTLLFNVDTAATLTASTVATEKHLVWNPDAGGSFAFLISGALAFVAYAHGGSLWDPTKVEWWSVVINFIGCVAFGVAAVASFVLPNGNIMNPTLSNNGTFVGALAFFVASLIVLPALQRGAETRASES